MRYITDKTVVITGAASGIGEALAHHFAALGAKLLLADVDQARLLLLKSHLQAKGVTCVARTCDVADPEALTALAHVAHTELGGADILINNAGVALVSPVQSLALTDAQWLMNINFWGVVNGSKAFMPQLAAKPESCIVNLSSIYAMVSMPTQSIYNASKAAVRAFSDALREELQGTSIHVLCVHPGGIKTRIAELARLGDISSVAKSPQALQEQFQKLARTSPEQTAISIVKAIQSGQNRVLIGADARIADWLFRVFPSKASHWLSSLAKKLQN